MKDFLKPVMLYDEINNDDNKKQQPLKNDCCI